MNDIAHLPGNTHAPAAAPARAPRVDLYGGIHKALRQFMCESLTRLGRADFGNADEAQAALGGVRNLLGAMQTHVVHENDFIHTAIEARRPGGARHTADDHLLHLDTLQTLAHEVDAVDEARGAQRQLLAARLYRHLGEFVGENLVHMQVEETQNNAALWELYTDDELLALHERLLATIGPAEMAVTARWMAASMNPQELAALYGAMQLKAPVPAFEALLEVARLQLAPARWALLCKALGRPAVPGLMTA